MNSAFSEPSQPPRFRGPSGLAILGWMGAGMLVGIVFLAWLGTPRYKSAVGQKVAQVELKPLLFAEHALSEGDLLGKITVLHFWGTWCQPCLREYPEFVKLANKLKSHPDVQVIAVSSSQGPEYNLEELKEQTAQFMQRYEAELPTYSDPAGLTRAQIMLLLPESALPYPSTLVLNPDGKITAIWLGYSRQGMTEVGKEVERLRRLP